LLSEAGPEKNSRPYLKNDKSKKKILKKREKERESW
jgi:hypothetical protein